MMAILLGIIMGNISHQDLREGLILGLDFTQKYILKLGIICFRNSVKSFVEFLKIWNYCDSINYSLHNKCS